VKGWDIEEKAQSQAAKEANIWFENKFNSSLSEIESNFEKYRISDALMLTYKLIWDDFCSNYLEIVKPNYGDSIDKLSYESTIAYFSKLMQILHPFMPFITEEVWHLLDGNRESDIIISQIPKSKEFDSKVLAQFEFDSEIINSIRNLRKQKNIPPKQELELFIKSNSEISKHSFDAIISKLAKLSKLSYTEDEVESSLRFMVKSSEFFIPFSEAIDKDAEIEKLQKELDYFKGFLISVEKKLSNKAFVDNAPEKVVKIEEKKKADAEEKINLISKQLEDLG
jgi:valyl-tRNA synthetase